MSTEKMKALLEEFVEKEAVTKEEIAEIEKQIEELEARIESSKQRLEEVGKDREKVHAMKSRYDDGDWSDVLAKVSDNGKGEPEEEVGGRESGGTPRDRKEAPASVPHSQPQNVADNSDVASLSGPESAAPGSVAPQSVAPQPVPIHQPGQPDSQQQSASPEPEPAQDVAPPELSQPQSPTEPPGQAPPEAAQALPQQPPEIQPALQSPQAGQPQPAEPSPQPAQAQPPQPQPPQPPQPQAPQPPQESLFSFSHGQDSMTEPPEVPWSPPSAAGWDPQAAQGFGAQPPGQPQFGQPDASAPQPDFQTQQGAAPGQQFAQPQPDPAPQPAPMQPIPQQPVPQQQPIAPSDQPPPAPGAPTQSSGSDVLTSAYDDEFDISDALGTEQEEPESKEDGKKINDALRGLFS